MNLLDKMIWILNGKPCLHKDRDIIQWIHDDTPMTTIICINCGETLDTGHVHGDIEDWEKVFEIRHIRDNKIQTIRELRDYDLTRVSIN